MKNTEPSTNYFAQQVNDIADRIAKLCLEAGSSTDCLIGYLQLAARDRLVGLQKQSQGDKLSQQYPKTFAALRKGTTYITASSLWNDMQVAGIEEGDLPIMEHAITEAEKASALPGHFLFQKFADYWDGGTMPS